MFLLSSVLINKNTEWQSISADVKRKKKTAGSAGEESYHSSFVNLEPKNSSGTMPTPEPLQFRWTLWFDDHDSRKGLSQREYLKDLAKVATFGNLPEFYSAWRKLTGSHFPPRAEANFRVFRSDIKPVWEDPKNRNGGKWVVIIREKPSEKTSELFRSLLLSLFMGEFGFQDNLCGAVLSLRSWGALFTVWNSDSRNIEEQTEILKKLQELFGTPKVKYQIHEGALKRQSSSPVNGSKSIHANSNGRKPLERPPGLQMEDILKYLELQEKDTAGISSDSENSEEGLETSAESLNSFVVETISSGAASTLPTFPSVLPSTLDLPPLPITQSFDLSSPLFLGLSNPPFRSIRPDDEESVKKKMTEEVTTSDFLSSEVAARTPPSAKENCSLLNKQIPLGWCIVLVAIAFFSAVFFVKLL